MGTYWQIFYVSQFFSLCCPFYIVKKSRQLSPSNHSDFYYKAVTWLPQKIICSVLAIANLIWMQHFVRGAIPNGVHVTPTIYLALLAEIDNALFKLTILWLHWFCKDEIIKIINFSVRLSNSFSNCKTETWKSRYLRVVGKAIFVCWCIAHPIVTLIHNLLWISGQRTEGKSWMAQRLEFMRYPFFLNFVMREVSANQSLSPLESAVSIWSTVTSFNQDVFYLNRVIILVLPLITLWPLVNIFTSKLRSSNFEMDFQDDLHLRILVWPVIKQEYKYLKTLATMINDLFGPAYICFIVGTIFYYSTKFSKYILHEINGIADIIDFVFVIIDFLANVVTYLLSADICTRVSIFIRIARYSSNFSSHKLLHNFQMQTTKKWMAMERIKKQIPLDEMDRMLRELDEKNVGIKITRSRPVTYGLLAKVR